MGEVRAQAAGAFRFAPPAVADDRVVLRPRLTTALRSRFDRRATVVQGVAGYGKTTALALALDANRMDPLGEDVWLGADEFDGDATHLVAGLARALGIAVTGTDDIEPLVDEVWRRAPGDVALVVDDAHLLDTQESTEVLAALLRRLPTNGHLVLAGRWVPALQLARLRAHQQLLELGPDDLAFDEEELDALRTARPDPPAAAGLGPLPRHPALADLQLLAGTSAGIDFVGEEILAGLDPDRTASLRRLAVLEEVDDTLARALSAGAYDAEGLLAGLPLIERSAAGRHRLHDLLRDALLAGIEPAERDRAAALAARVEAGRNRLRAAVRLLADPADPAPALALARRFVLRATLHRTFEDQTAVRTIVEQLDPGSVLARLLRLECHWGEFSTTTDHRHLVGHLDELAEAAQEEGDEEIEAIVRFRAVQGAHLESLTTDPRHVARLEDLAGRSTYAAQVVRYAWAERAMYDGDPDAARAAVAVAVVGADPEVEQVMAAGLRCALGEPEEVSPSLLPTDLAGLPDGSEIYVACAMWMRGELPPAPALEYGRAMVPPTLARRMVTPSVAMLGVVAQVAVAAGDLRYARELLDRARAVERFACPAYITTHTAMARAALVASEDGDEAAAAVLDEALGIAPLGRWPALAHLLGLSLLYVTRPPVRATLDACRFGPSVSTGLDGARALVELRATGDRAGAEALPWDRPNVLRAQLAPPHLCELAAAAAVAGVTGASELLAQIPDHRRHLRAAIVRGGPVGPLAEQALQGVPAAPDVPLLIEALGPLRVLRGGDEVGGADWRRGRVQELLALLVEDRKVSRARAAAVLWPDLDGPKAASNLRVTLSYLQRVLEPDRTRDDRPTYVRQVGPFLVLADAVEIDADRLEITLDLAAEHDRSGNPHAALAAYRAALDAYAGDYLEQVEAEWVEATRSRLRFLAVNAMCRIGELTLARGEPEDAGAWAHRARRRAPLNERAERLLVSCLVATGDRVAAAATARDLVAGLAEIGLEPERETALVLRRLDLVGGL